MVFEGLVGLGVALLLAPAFAEYAKIRKRAERGFNWLAASGVWFIFAATFGAGYATTLGGYLGATAWGGLGSIFEIIGWLFALIETIFVVYEMLVEK
jgi:hypothetical protein